MSSRTLIGWGAWSGMLGGILWAVLPLGTVAVDIQDARPGTLVHLASATVYWLLAVLPLALLLVGLVGLRALHAETYGRLGNAGFLVSFAGLALMFVGNGVEVASLTFSGSESAVGHSLFLIGFLLLLAGSVPLGIAIIRTRRDLPWQGRRAVARRRPAARGLARRGWRGYLSRYRPRLLGSDHRPVRGRLDTAGPRPALSGP